MKDSKDKYIKEMLEGLKPDSPSEGFTDRVMQQINTLKVQQKSQSSFLKKYRFIIIFTITFVFISILVFLFPDSQTDTTNQHLLINQVDYSFIDKLRNFFSLDVNIPFTYVIISIAFSLLLLIDNIIPFINKRFIDKIYGKH